MPTNRKENLKRFIASSRDSEVELALNQHDYTFVDSIWSYVRNRNLAYKVGLYCIAIKFFAVSFLVVYDIGFAEEFIWEAFWLSMTGVLLLSLEYAREFYRTGLKINLYGILWFVVFYVIGFANVYAHYGVSIDSKISHDLIDGLYLSLITWATVGYGDAIPVGDGRYYAMFEGVISYILMAVILAKLMFLYQEERVQ